jgi:hypothetical protein
MKLFVGIDVSKARLDVSFLDSDQHELVQLAVSNDVPGASKIKETILKFQKQTRILSLEPINWSVKIRFVFGHCVIFSSCLLDWIQLV